MSVKGSSPQAHEGPKRPYSIDLSLELEHQLENESLPPTPAFKGRPASYDQNVVASVIQQLQTDVEHLTRERDDLRDQLSRADADKGGIQETLLQFSAKCEQMEEELEAAKVKMRDDEHAISMLRTKVEESRRGLMRLQTENRRMSQANMSVDTTRTSLTSFATPASSKRQSFTPLTGSGATRPNAHKRISSISDSGFLLTGSVDIPGSPSPNAQTITMPELSSSTSSMPPVSNRRFSVFSTRSSPPQSLDLAPRDPVLEELDALRREMKTLKGELEETRNELTEANEAREASETCAKALREFIGEMKPSASESEAVKLPPMPTDTTGAEADTKQASTGWGFKMWKMEPAVKPESTSVPPVGTRRMWKLDTAVKAAPTPATTSSPSSASAHQPTASTSSAPFASKVGGFFSSRASVSSTTSSNPPHRQSILREPSFNHSSSDTSSIEESVVEPTSPADGVPGAIVKIRGGSASSSTDFISPEHVKALNDPATVVQSILPTPAS